MSYYYIIEQLTQLKECRKNLIYYNKLLHHQLKKKVINSSICSYYCQNISLYRAKQKQIRLSIKNNYQI